MKSLRLMCWRMVVDSGSFSVDDAYVGWPPLKIHPNGQIDLEFSTLLLAEKVIMDSNAYYRLTSKPPLALSTAAKSLKLLKAEGIISLRNYDDELRPYRKNIIDQTNRTLSSLSEYVSPIRDAVKVWDEASIEFSRILNQIDEHSARLPYGIFAAISSDRILINDDRITQAREILQRSPRRLSRMERDFLREIVRPYIDHAHSGLALFRADPSPIIDWSDMRSIYDKTLQMGIENVSSFNGYSNVTRDLFSLSLPDIEPSNINEYLHIYRKKAAAEFRDFVGKIAKHGIPEDRQLLNSIIKEMSGLSGYSSASGSVVNAVGTSASLIGACLESAIPGAGLGLSVSTSLGLGLSQEFMGRILSATHRTELSWILCFIGAKRKKR